MATQLEAKPNPPSVKLRCCSICNATEGPLLTNNNQSLCPTHWYEKYIAPKTPPNND